MNNEVVQKSIIDELGLSNLPDKEKEELIAEIGEVAAKKIFLELTDQMNTEDQKMFVQLSNRDPRKAEDFLREKVPHYESIIYNTLESFTKELREASLGNKSQ